MNKVYFFLFFALFTYIKSTGQAQILKESFEGSFPPTGWVIQNNGSGNNWVQDTVMVDAYHGQKSLQYFYNDTSAANVWAYTPKLNLTGRSVTVTFYVKVFSSSYPEKLKLTVGTDTTVASQTTVLIDNSNITNVTYQKWTATYIPPAAGDYRFALNCYSSAAEYSLYVDSFTVFQTLPPCTGTPVGGVANTSLSLVCPSNPFLLSINGATTGFSNISYQWQSSTDSLNWSDIFGANNETDSINSLSVSTYFRRAITCTTGGTVYSTVVYVKVNPNVLCVCSPSTGTILHSLNGAPAIDTVNIAGTTLNSIISTTIPTGGYYLFNDTTIMPSLQQGKTYSLKTSFNANAIASVWFDWDKSGSFDASEWTSITTNDVGGTISFTVPVTALLGKTSMRVRAKRTTGGTNTALDACTDLTYGETIDYLINITPGLPCAGMPDSGFAIASSNSVCPSSNLILSDSAGTSNVLGLTFQWQSSADNVTWANITKGTYSKDTITGITSPTYFRRVTSCNNSGLTAYSKSVKVYNSPAINCICSPLNGIVLHTGTVTASPAIDTVNIIGTVLNNVTGTTIPTGGYSLFNDTTKMPSLQRTQTYSLKASFNSFAIASVWFDWNQDGVLDASEWTQITGNSYTGTIQFAVPANALLGKTMMRIRAKTTSNGGNSATDACTPFVYGETEDYLINITNSAACSAPVTVKANSITASGSTLTWTAPSVVPSNGYNILYNTVNRFTTATMAATNVSLNTFTLSGLSGNMLYYAWVVGNCGTSISDTIATTSFTTSCGPMSVFPINEGFESIVLVGSGTVPKCWTTKYKTNNFASDNQLHNKIGPRTGTRYATSKNNSNAWLISPAIHMLAGHTYSFSYYYRPTDLLQSFTLSTFISTAADTTILSANLLGSISAITDSSTYHQASYSYTATTTGDYYFALRSLNSSSTTSYMCYDDFSITSSSPAFTIQGNVVSPNKKSVPYSTIYLTGSNTDSAISTGTYLLSEFAGGNYLLRAKKNNDINKANGVTTLDLALIQSHILGKSSLNSPYKIIAADVNKDNKVTTLDLVYIKRLILGIDTVYPSKTLWAFVDSSYSFADQLNPFPYKDSISISNLTAPIYNNSFIGIKLGDVNWDWNPAIARPASNYFIKPNKISIKY